MRHPFPDHEAFCSLPEGIHPGLPLDLFGLFWSTRILDELVNNTNAYAEMKKKKKEKPPMYAATWALVTVRELKIWLGIVVLMGLYRIKRPRECWSKTDGFVKYSFVKHMTRDRFQAIRCMLHVAPPTTVE
ncbi:hypothetical protein P3T76_013602 [Phytophthora citrophthora]|uniref:PiggyBac transposable element-derived protein domain-containing protein n=1 Tax=Phytophthora citrophthora TaxID=4793 RepID=A0AAD9LCZ9_9STRA|nr:hypothetical protein P3T76_013601 [Phytophthora citrophthora]KAK1931013.1 hypothetical protein P3T76_013602 [Phytophthora citrophthora]